MDARTIKWTERKLGRKIEVVNGRVRVTRAELEKLRAGPSPYRLIGLLLAGFLSAQLFILLGRYFGG